MSAEVLPQIWRCEVHEPIPGGSDHPSGDEPGSIHGDVATCLPHASGDIRDPGRTVVLGHAHKHGAVGIRQVLERWGMNEVSQPAIPAETASGTTTSSGQRRHTWYPTNWIMNG